MKASCYIGKEIAVAKRGPFFKIKKKIWSFFYYQMREQNVHEVRVVSLKNVNDEERPKVDFMKSLKS